MYINALWIVHRYVVSDTLLNEAEVGIIITTLKGEILAMDKHAKEIGELEQWHIPCIS